MSLSDDDVRWVEPPKVGFWGASFLPAIAAGLATTLRHVVVPTPLTQQFPEEKPDLPANYRGVHRLNRDEQGRVKCVACFMCATACPAHCIAIEAAAAPADWPDRDKFPASFVIDELKCIYCGMCEEACPCDAIEMTSLYDISGLTREQMLFDREKLLSIYDETAGKEVDPPRTHRGRLSGASEIDVTPSSATRAVGAPALEQTPQAPVAPPQPSAANLAPSEPVPGAPRNTHPNIGRPPKPNQGGT